ncbi:hypothetical protein PPO43_05700 [Saprospira sp. CCB-QB6]|uniref:hypothetical protein n=1 Tax=Saprospira sp. CCB-QB6 TaxID=3023936 RepID=UPI00234AF5DF|nr:hypothetical protein [Saprospira sp. CCB-QB6]WCL82592.1 hypothetical protein PPO43_05700 [Saprospira sp. CCB-QB6]
MISTPKFPQILAVLAFLTLLWACQSTAKPEIPKMSSQELLQQPAKRSGSFRDEVVVEVKEEPLYIQQFKAYMVDQEGNPIKWLGNDEEGNFLILDPGGFMEGGDNYGGYEGEWRYNKENDKIELRMQSDEKWSAVDFKLHSRERIELMGILFQADLASPDSDTAQN